MASGKTRKMHVRHYIYVWQWPVRAFHWINAIAIVVLAVTGYLIGDPIAFQSSAEASGSVLVRDGQVHPLPDGLRVGGHRPAPDLLGLRRK